MSHIMNFKQLIGQYALGNLMAAHLIDVAYQGLLEGFESPSLIILAGIEKNGNPFEIEQYLKSALIELGINIPDRRTASLEYATIIAQDIIEGRKDIFKGVSEMIYKVLHRFGFIAETVYYLYDSINFEGIYGLYHTCDDLLCADHAWSAEKSNQELMEEVKEELLEALKQWVLDIRVKESL